MVRTRLFAALAVVLLCVVASSQTPMPGGTLEAAQQQALVRTAAQILEEEYVFADAGKRAATELRRSLSAGRYETPVAREAFAKKLTDEIFAVLHDKHVRLRDRLGSTPPPPSQRNPEADKFGVRDVSLQGDIGYLRVDAFYRGEESRAAFDSAMAKLAGAKVLVIDLRENGGGSDANLLLASYLFGESVHLNTIKWRSADPLEFWTDVSAKPKFAGPVYVLVSGKTFSAAEAFAYGVQQQKRAIIVGETTRGGANPNRFFALDLDFDFSVSVGRAENPVSKANWEGVGIKPDIAVSALNALDAAIEHATKVTVSSVR